MEQRELSLLRQADKACHYERNKKEEDHKRDAEQRDKISTPGAADFHRTPDAVHVMFEFHEDRQTAPKQANNADDPENRPALDAGRNQFNRGGCRHRQVAGDEDDDVMSCLVG